MDARPRKHQKIRTSTYEVASEIIAQLMWGPKLQVRIIESVDADRKAICRWLKGLHGSGVIRICRYEKSIKHLVAVWELQAKPFAMPDAKREDFYA